MASAQVAEVISEEQPKHSSVGAGVSNADESMARQDLVLAPETTASKEAASEKSETAEDCKTAVKDEVDTKADLDEEESLKVSGQLDNEEAQKASDEAATEELKEVSTETAPQVENSPKEPEEDDVDDDREKVQRSAVAWSLIDSTMNAIVGSDGNLLMPVTDAGCHYLDAGVRAAVGLKAGRYLFEVTILENLVRPCGNAKPQHVVRIGVSLSATSVFLGYSKDNVCFDSHGFYWYDGQKTPASVGIGRGQTLGLLVNLDTNSKNANTLSVFRNGHRMCTPQPLPEALQGKVLYPTITFKCVSLYANLGPLSRVPMPFKCRMVRDAVADDIEELPLPQHDTCEVLFPVGLPNEGVFDYVDFFHKQHPHYVELSDRKILEWGWHSGLHNNFGSTSRDKPDVKMGLPAGLDGHSMRALFTGLAPFVKRNYIVMELRGNLLAAERKKRLQHFSGTGHKKVALVLMGEPSNEYKEFVQSLVLTDKKKVAEMMKAAEMATQQRTERIRQQMAQRSEGKDGHITGSSNDAKDQKAQKEKDAEDPKAENQNDKSDNSEKQPNGENDMEEENAQEEVELTEEEKKLWHRKQIVPDMKDGEISASFVNFTLPKEEEGFDEVRFVWQTKEASESYLRNWIRQQKQTQYVTNLYPSAAFKGAYESWNKLLLGWKQNQMDAKARQEKAKQDKKDTPKDAGNSGANEDQEQRKAPESRNIDWDDIDIESVEDITNVRGSDEPLYLHFAYEDWVLLRLRYELHVLVHAYREDLNDPDRPSFRQSHLQYVYEKYFQKQITLWTFAVDSVTELLELVEDTIGITTDTDMLQAKFPKETPPEKFVKLTEEERRDRLRRVDAGDESAALNFQSPNQAVLRANPGGFQQSQTSVPRVPVPGVLGSAPGVPPMMQAMMAQVPAPMMQAMMAQFSNMAQGAMPQVPGQFSNMPQGAMPQAQSAPASAPPPPPPNPLINVFRRLGEQHQVQKAQKARPQVPPPPRMPSFTMPPASQNMARSQWQPAPQVAQGKPPRPPTNSPKQRPAKRQKDTGSSREAGKKESWDANTKDSWASRRKESWANTGKDSSSLGANANSSRPRPTAAARPIFDSNAAASSHKRPKYV